MRRFPSLHFCLCAEESRLERGIYFRSETGDSDGIPSARGCYRGWGRNDSYRVVLGATAYAGSGSRSDNGGFRQYADLGVNGYPERPADLSRCGSVASQATVSLRIFYKKGVTPQGLTSSDFTLTVNGTPREGKLQAPGASEVPVVPMVLIVFPSNQPIVHSIGVKRAEKYFSSLSDEVLPWRVGILDSNGKATAFTNGRSQLLAFLDIVDHTNEPFEYWSDAGLRSNAKWDGGWLVNAEEAIALWRSRRRYKIG